MGGNKLELKRECFITHTSTETVFSSAHPVSTLLASGMLVGKLSTFHDASPKPVKGMILCKSVMETLL